MTHRQNVFVHQVTPRFCERHDSLAQRFKLAGTKLPAQSLPAISLRFLPDRRLALVKSSSRSLSSLIVRVFVFMSDNVRHPASFVNRKCSAEHYGSTGSGFIDDPLQPIC